MTIFLIVFTILLLGYGSFVASQLYWHVAHDELMIELGEALLDLVPEGVCDTLRVHNRTEKECT